MILSPKAWTTNSSRRYHRPRQGMSHATEDQATTPHLPNDSMGKKTVPRTQLESWKSPFSARLRPQKVKGKQRKPRNIPMLLRMLAAAIWTFPSLETRVAQIKGGRPEKNLTLQLTWSVLLPKTSAPLRLCKIFRNLRPLSKQRVKARANWGIGKRASTVYPPHQKHLESGQVEDGR